VQEGPPDVSEHDGASRESVTSDARLREKYGTAIFDDPPSITRDRLTEKLAQRDALDQHFARASLVDFAGVGLRRRVLDARTRFLVQIGQFTVTRSHRHLEDSLRAAIAANVPPREALEAILQCHIYAGEVVVDPALAIFTRIADELGVLDGLRDGQLPLDGRDRERDLEGERRDWKPQAAGDPRREGLMERHGWLGISAGIRYKGVQHLDILEYRDAIDPEWAGLWLRFAYQDMYSRGILDDRTRLLCTVGDCVALGEAIQSREHMQGAMAAGASAAEVLEVVQMSAIHFGFPRMGGALRTFVGIMAEQGRLDEIGDPPVDPQLRAAAAKAG
jgi:alkylhydroperoxidase/carboxymuconolactone decarboxylase family protein YurZ